MQRSRFGAGPRALGPTASSHAHRCVGSSRRLKARWLPTFLALGWASAAASDEGPPYRGSRVESEAREAGYATVEAIPWADGFAVVERREGAFFLSRVRTTGRRLELLQRLGPWSGERLVRLEGVDLDGAAPAEVLVATEEAAPDEKVHRVAIYGLRESRLESRFEKRITLPDRRRDRSDVRFGPAEPGWDLEETKDGLQLVWTRGPRVLRVPRGDDGVTFTIGAETTVYRWNGEALAEVPSASYRDFLPPLSVSDVDGRRGDAPLEVAGVADGELDSAWVLPSRGWSGSTVTMQLPRTETIRMVRVVPGCARDEDSWAKHREIRSFRVDLGGALEITIDRSRPDVVPPGVKAWAEFPLFSSFGRQVVLFLEPPRRAGWARFTPLALKPASSRQSRACVAEIALH